MELINSYQKSGQLFDQISSDSRDGFCYGVKEVIGVYTGLTEMWPYHSREDPAMAFHLYLSRRRDLDVDTLKMNAQEFESEFVKYLKNFPI